MKERAQQRSTLMEICVQPSEEQQLAAQDAIQGETQLVMKTAVRGKVSIIIVAVPFEVEPSWSIPSRVSDPLLGAGLDQWTSWLGECIISRDQG
jgi:hypothetical protein